MVELRSNVSLSDCNTLRLPATSKQFARVTARDQLPPLITYARNQQLPLLMLGGGSNVVFRDDFAGLCVQMATRGIRVVAEDDASVTIEAEAGEEWHGFVDHCLTNGWYGLENLALIPGTVGAAPIQNVGAYGVEVKEFVESVTVLDLACGKTRVLSCAACEFGYRDSIFKGTLRDQVIIVAVTFRLRRSPSLALRYQGLIDALATIDNPQPRDLFEQVVAMRQAKLPDPAQLPNAGSFFKNPLVSASDYERLLKAYPGMVAYAEGEQFKLAAGWLIEKAGWKGYRSGNVGVHAHQALVLVHFGGGDGSELLALAGCIQEDIETRFGVLLEIEPRIY